MNRLDQSVLFTGSRAKQLPIVILMPVFLFILGYPLVAFVTLGLDNGVDVKLAAVCGAFGLIFFLFLYAETIFVRLLIRPNSLVVSREGLSITKFGKTTSYLWPQLGDPVKKYVSSGKSGSFFISMSQASGKPLLIPAETYIQSFDDVLATIQDAKAGRALTQPTKSDIKPSTRFAIPITLSASIVFYGAVARYVWEIAYMQG